MNLLQTEDLVKGYPDQRLMQEAQNPTGEVPQFLLVSEVQRRAKMRKQYEQSQPTPEGTVAEQILQEGGAQTQGQPPGPPGRVAPNMPYPLPKGPGIAPNPQQPPPPQNPNAAIAPRGMAQGGVVQLAQGGRTLTITMDGQPLQISTDGYASDEAAFAAHLSGENPPIGGGDDYGDDNPLENPYYRGNPSDAPHGQGAMDIAFDAQGNFAGSAADAGFTPPTAALPGPAPKQGPVPPPQYHTTPDPEPTSFGGDGIPKLPYKSPTDIWEQGSRAVFEPMFRGIEGINAGHKATLDAVNAGETPVTPRPYAGSLASEYAPYDPEKTLDVARGLKVAGNATLGAGREDAGLPALFDVEERRRDPSDVPALADIPEGAATEGIATLPTESDFVGPPAPTDTPQKSGLTDATVQGSTAYRAKLAAMVGQQRTQVPDFSNEIGAQKQAAYSNMLMQLGAGIMKGDMAGGVERGGAAMAVGNKEAREIGMKAKMAQYTADRADQAQDIEILSELGDMDLREKRNVLMAADRMGISENAQLRIISELRQDYADALTEEGIMGPDRNMRIWRYMAGILEGKPELADKFPNPKPGGAAGTGEKKRSLSQIKADG